MLRVISWKKGNYFVYLICLDWGNESSVMKQNVKRDSKISEGLQQ